MAVITLQLVGAIKGAVRGAEAEDNTEGEIKVCLFC